MLLSQVGKLTGVVHCERFYINIFSFGDGDSKEACLGHALSLSLRLPRLVSVRFHVVPQVFFL